MIEKGWKFTEDVLYFLIGKRIGKERDDASWLSFLQFVKFGIVGVTNSAISYFVYLILIRLGMHYTPANIIGFTVSVLNSFYWNNKYVFEPDAARIWWKTLLKTYISYAGTGIVLSNILLYLWIDVIGINAVVAPLINLLITVPINFFVNKFWAYRKTDQ